MKLNLLALSLFAGAAISKSIGQAEICSDVTKLTGDLDETSRYLHEQKRIFAEFLGSTEHSNRDSLTVHMASPSLLATGRHMQTFIDDALVLAKVSSSDSVIVDMHDRRERLEEKIAKLEGLASDHERSGRSIDVVKLAGAIDIMAEKTDRARRQLYGSGLLRHCPNGRSAINQRRDAVTDLLDAVLALLGLVSDDC